ncbi:MAG: MBL fold metallo-hydrolase [Deltaproteobacteria bacterium]|nr:MAG: MBL fold metallo-hydrolase [Deltaproteobacteria bacterium]
MKIKFWGTRGSIASPGRDTVKYGGNTTCVEVISSEGARIVVDAGSGIRLLGEHIRDAEERADLYLLITHIHWDHLLGFPFFSPIHDEKAEIKVDGYPTCMKGIRYPFDNQMGDGFFPISFEDLEAKITYLGVLKREPLRIGGMVVDKVVLNHPQGGYGYKFEQDGKTFVFITDNELGPAGQKDGIQHLYVEFCKGADILVHDAQYTPEEFSARRGWGHSNFEDALELALRAGVRKLLLFHHDPTRTDKELEAIEQRCRKIVKDRDSTLEVEAAREGEELVL